MLSYNDLVLKFGAATAYQYLVEIEKAAHIRSIDVQAIDPETRLERACALQDQHHNAESVAA